MKIKNTEKEPLLRLTTPKGVEVVIYPDVVKVDGAVVSWDYIVRLINDD